MGRPRGFAERDGARSLQRRGGWQCNCHANLYNASFFRSWAGGRCDYLIDASPGFKVRHGWHDRG